MSFLATGQRKKPTRVPPNMVGTFLKLQIDDYVQSSDHVTRGGVQRDLSKVLGCTPDAVDNWYEGRNGVKHLMAEKLAFIFDATTDQITDGGEYTPPATPPKFDKVAFAKHVLATTNARPPDQLKVEDLRRDLRDTATEYLRTVGKLRDPLQPATAPIGDRMPKPTVELPIPEEAEDRWTQEPELPEPVAEVRQVTSNQDERNQIQMFLYQAEKFRGNNNLEWFIDGNRLRARRVITEEF